MTYTKGDINHNVQPVIGWLRLALRDDKPLSKRQMEAAVAKLKLACAAEHELLLEEVPMSDRL